MSPNICSVLPARVCSCSIYRAQIRSINWATTTTDKVSRLLPPYECSCSIYRAQIRPINWATTTKQVWSQDSNERSQNASRGDLGRFPLCFLWGKSGGNSVTWLVHLTPLPPQGLLKNPFGPPKARALWMISNCLP